jgi:hypothetical protein
MPSNEEKAPKMETPRELISPEAQAYVNASINEAIRGIFTQLAPVLQSIALTPEKIAEAERLRRAPTEEEMAHKLREERERKQWGEDEKANRANQIARQKNCPHKDAKQNWSVSLVHNYPDHQARGLCMLCHKLFEPKHWIIAAPDANNPRGRAMLVEPDPQYFIVQILESLS